MSYSLTYRFTCEDNKEMVNSKNEADIAPLVVSTCQSDGQWSKNILDYQCLGSVIFVLMIYILVK